MSKDFGACSMQPFVAVRVVHMPMGIDKVLDRVGVDACEGLRDVGLRDGKTRVDEQLAVLSSKDSDIPTRAHEHADVVAQRFDDDCGGGSGLSHCVDSVAVLSKRLTRGKHCGGARQGGRFHEITTRDDRHSFSPC
jgi:hypothetical protein